MTSSGHQHTTELVGLVEAGLTLARDGAATVERVSRRVGAQETELVELRTEHGALARDFKRVRLAVEGPDGDDDKRLTTRLTKLEQGAKHTVRRDDLAAFATKDDLAALKAELESERSVARDDKREFRGMWLAIIIAVLATVASIGTAIYTVQSTPDPVIVKQSAVVHQSKGIVP